MDKKGSEKNNKKDGFEEFSSILSGIKTYLYKSDNNFHNHLFLAYCNVCQSITAIGGDYTVYAGTDCGGDHYKTEKSPEQCIKCHGPNFIKLIDKDYDKDFSQLEKMYGQRTPEIIISGIKNGLEDMSSPSLYNSDLPKMANRWKRLKKETKIKQIKSYIGHVRKIKNAKRRVKHLEKMFN